MGHEYVADRTIDFYRWFRPSSTMGTTGEGPLGVDWVPTAIKEFEMQDSSNFNFRHSFYFAAQLPKRYQSSIDRITQWMSAADADVILELAARRKNRAGN